MEQKQGAVEETSTQQADSKLIFVKAASKGEDSKGREKLDLRFSEEETATLKEELSKIEGRAKLQIHIGEGTYGPSVFLFVKEVQEAPAYSSKKQQGGASANTQAAKIAALKKNSSAVGK